MPVTLFSVSVNVTTLDCSKARLLQAEYFIPYMALLAGPCLISIGLSELACCTVSLQANLREAVVPWLSHFNFVT